MIKILKYLLLSVVILAVFAAFYGCKRAPVYGNNADSEVDSEEVGDGDNTEKVQLFLLKIDGQAITYLSSEEEILQLLEEIVNENSSEEYLDIKLANEVQIESVFCEPSRLSDAENARRELQESGVKLSFIYSKNIAETVATNYSTIYENSALYYEGTSVSKTEGQNGEIERIFEITYADGLEIAREMVSETVKKQPIDKVILVGTLKSTASTGSYAWPIKGTIYITSYFGGRTINGVYDYHYGIDLRAAVGVSVYASDGGKVIYAGSMGSYGNLVKIEHDNGDVTYYGHLSSISVKVGERVYKGQLIAKSGATGNVTGPHLNF